MMMFSNNNSSKEKDNAEIQRTEDKKVGNNNQICHTSEKHALKDARTIKNAILLSFGRKEAIMDAFTSCHQIIWVMESKATKHGASIRIQISRNVKQLEVVVQRKLRLGVFLNGS